MSTGFSDGGTQWDVFFQLSVPTRIHNHIQGNGGNFTSTITFYIRFKQVFLYLIQTTWRWSLPLL